MRRLSLRVRLTLVFAVVMAMVIAAMGAFVYLRLESSLTHSLDRNLTAQLSEVAHHRTERGGLIDPDASALAQLLTPAGNVARSSPRSSQPLLTPVQVARVERGERLQRSGVIAGHEGGWRLLATRTPGGKLVAAVAGSLSPVESALDHLLTQLLIAGPIAVLLAALAGYWLASSALQPVEAMRRRAEHISAGTPAKRLPVPQSQDEIGRLGRTLNDMLARIEAALEHERRFVADASHELRTPLALLKAEIELALRRKRSAEELEQALRSAAVETDRLSRLAEDLLLIARSDQGALPIRREPVPVAQILATVAERYESAAGRKRRGIEVAPSDGLRVDADAVRLEQALGNLVDNALTHGSGTVELYARLENGAVELHVTDEGPGFADAFLDRAFERFSRADEARGAGGSGLGLAIVKLVATAHGGSAGARNTPAGADVWLSLPLSPPSHPPALG